MAPGGARQRRRSGTTGRGSLSKSPDCPLLLDAPRSGGGEPVRPVPGASEWEPLARVRRVVRKTFPSGDLPADRTRTAVATCAADAPARQVAGRRRREAPVSRGRGRRAEAGGPKRWRRSAWRRLRSGPERRRPPIADRQADDMLDDVVAGIGALAPAARARRGDALRQRAEAEAQQGRGAAVAARAGRAARRSGAERTARGRHGAGFRGTARRQQLVAGDRACRAEAQRLCQPDRAIDALGRPVSMAWRDAAR